MPDTAPLRPALTHYLRVAIARATGRSPFSRTVILAGSGRSGTTWVGNIINHQDDYRVLFEPIHREKVPAFRSFRNRQYLREQSADPAFLEPLRRLLEGRISNKWVDSRNRNWSARKLLIKDIRANLLLKWLSRHHPGTKIVLLLRHPCAVAASRVRLGWAPFQDAFLTQPELMEDFLEPFRDVLESSHSDLVGNAVCWCVENYVPLKQFPPGTIHVCYYERFILEAEKEVRRLVEFLGESFPEDLDTVLSRTSDTNWNLRERPSPAFDQWKHEIQAGDYAQVKAVLERFGMGRFYDDRGYPLMPSICP